MAIRKRTPKDSTNKTCKQMTNLVLGYVTGTLGAAIKRDFERHLRLCPDCVNFLNTYRKTVAVAKSVDAAEIPEPVRESILNFLRRQTRCLAALVFYLFAHAAV